MTIDNDKNPFETPMSARQMGEWVASFIPRVTPTASGYEIRTKILELAQSQAIQEYQWKSDALGIETKVENGDVVQKVEIPNANAVLKIANDFLDFVNRKN